jgi:FkbM family methyltransferase
MSAIPEPRSLSICRWIVDFLSPIPVLADRAAYWLNELVIARLGRHQVAVRMRQGPYVVLPLSDHNLRSVALAGVYEPDVAAFAALMVKPGDTVIDVGAHVGLHTMNFASLVGDAGTVHAFEPSSRASACLEEAMHWNGYADRVVLHRAAAGASEGEVAFYLDTKSGLTSSTVESWTLSAQRGLVTCVTLDRALEGAVVRSPALLKIDAEGAEAAVLEGARILLAETPPRGVILEVSSNADAFALVSRMREYGYEIHGEARIPEMTSHGYDSAEFDFGNLAFVHRASLD